MKSKSSLENFTWERVWAEIETCCPLLASILKGCLPPHESSTVPSLCISANVLFKLRNPHLQGIISFLLKSGHTTKQVKRFGIAI